MTTTLLTARLRPGKVARWVLAGAWLAAAAVPAPAGADPGPASNWTRVSAPSAGGCAYYVDQGSIRTREAYKEAWFMNSCDAIQATSGTGKPGYLSKTLLQYFDCKAGRTAIVQLKYYSGPHATGEMVEQHDWSHPPVFEQDPAGSNGALWLAMVCRGFLAPGR